MSKLFVLAFLSDDAFLGSVADVKDNLCFQPRGGGGYSLVRASWGRAASQGIRDDKQPARMFYELNYSNLCFGFGLNVLNRVS